MATNKSKASPKLLSAGGQRISWRRLIIFMSVTLNVGFVVIWLSFAGTSALDGLFMANGLERYCAGYNDDKFVSSTEKVKALREYVCDRPEADKYFQEGYAKYLDAKGIPRATNE
jgi:hypothetical protein